MRGTKLLKLDTWYMFAISGHLVEATLKDIHPDGFLSIEPEGQVGDVHPYTIPLETITYIRDENRDFVFRCEDYIQGRDDLLREIVKRIQEDSDGDTIAYLKQLAKDEMV